MPLLGPILSFFGGLFGKLVGPIMAYIAGKRSAQAKAAKKNLEGIGDAIKARERVRSDPAERERLRNKRKKRAGG